MLRGGSITLNDILENNSLLILILATNVKILEISRLSLLRPLEKLVNN